MIEDLEIIHIFFKFFGEKLNLDSSSKEGSLVNNLGEYFYFRDLEEQEDCKILINSISTQR